MLGVGLGEGACPCLQRSPIRRAGCILAAVPEQRAPEPDCEIVVQCHRPKPAYLKGGRQEGPSAGTRHLTRRSVLASPRGGQKPPLRDLSWGLNSLLTHEWRRLGKDHLGERVSWGHRDGWGAGRSPWNQQGSYPQR